MTLGGSRPTPLIDTGEVSGESAAGIAWRPTSSGAGAGAADHAA